MSLEIERIERIERKSSELKREVDWAVRVGYREEERRGRGRCGGLLESLYTSTYTTLYLGR